MDSINIKIPDEFNISIECIHLLNGLLQQNSNDRFDYSALFNHKWIIGSSKPIEIPNKDIIEETEPIFYNHFHCFSENDYLIINSPPQNTFSNYSQVSAYN